MTTPLNDSPYVRSLIRDSASAVNYETCVFTDGLCLASKGMLFSGIHIANAGSVTIRGADGEDTTIALTAGVWPFGGSAIVESGTTVDAPDITILY